MSEVKRINDQLRRAFDGEAWHGPSVLELLKDVSAVQAAAHPIEGAHSIWELALHIAAWENVARKRIVEGVPFEPKRGRKLPTGSRHKRFRVARRCGRGQTKSRVFARGNRRIRRLEAFRYRARDDLHGLLPASRSRSARSLPRRSDCAVEKGEGPIARDKIR